MVISIFMKINKIFFILLLAIILRFIFINYTPSLNPDEAAVAYRLSGFPNVIRDGSRAEREGAERSNHHGRQTDDPLLSLTANALP